MPIPQKVHFGREEYTDIPQLLENRNYQLLARLYVLWLYERFLESKEQNESTMTQIQFIPWAKENSQEQFQEWMTRCHESLSVNFSKKDLEEISWEIECELQSWIGD